MNPGRRIVSRHECAFAIRETPRSCQTFAMPDAPPEATDRRPADQELRLHRRPIFSTRALRPGKAIDDLCDGIYLGQRYGLWFSALKSLVCPRNQLRQSIVAARPTELTPKSR